MKILEKRGKIWNEEREMACQLPWRDTSSEPAVCRVEKQWQGARELEVTWNIL